MLPARGIAVSRLGPMWHRVDGVAAALSREDAIDATAVSDTPRRPRRGPNRLKFGPETTPGIVCEIRVTSRK